MNPEVHVKQDVKQKPDDMSNSNYKRLQKRIGTLKRHIADLEKAKSVQQARIDKYNSWIERKQAKITQLEARMHLNDATAAVQMNGTNGAEPLQ